MATLDSLPAQAGLSTLESTRNANLKMRTMLHLITLTRPHERVQKIGQSPVYMQCLDCAAMYILVSLHFSEWMYSGHGRQEETGVSVCAQRKKNLEFRVIRQSVETSRLVGETVYPPSSFANSLGDGGRSQKP